jgi:phosphate starvation-inducible PhoH-like protein
MIKIILTPKLNGLLKPKILLYIQNLSNVEIKIDGSDIIIKGENKFLVQEMLQKIEGETLHRDISEEELRAIYVLHMKKESFRLAGLKTEIRPKSEQQREYMKILDSKEIIFASGSAGTGKTHIAAAFGLNALLLRKIERLILSRPAVEAGEKLGFLPGELKDKLDPYLRPLYDELLSWLDVETLEKYISQRKIEIAPLAYMRGRTLKNAWIILDEAQNTTVGQMKMFLTRIGYGSTMVVTGDESQIDLYKTKSGLSDAITRFNNIDSIGIVRFGKESIIRHKIVRQILQAYGDT